MKKISELDRSVLGIAGLVLSVILFFSVNIIAAFTLKSYRMDLTQSKLYSLSAGSLDIIDRIREPVTIRFYLSGKLAKVSKTHAAYAIRVIELLEQYVSASNGKIKLEVVDPEPFSKKEDEALAYGLKGIPTGNSSHNGYIGLTLSNSSDRRKTISLADPSRERFLEYDITKSLKELTTAKRPVVGIISTLPIDGRGAPNLMYPKYHPRWEIMNIVRDLFNVRFISRQTLDIPADIDVLMLVNPKKFNEETMYAIDQYVMRGGNMLILADPLSEIEADLGETSYSVRPDLDRLLTKWGIAFDSKNFVADMKLAQTVFHTQDDKTVKTKFPPRLAINGNHLNPDDPVTGTIRLLNLSYAGAFDVTKKVDGLTVTPLIFSSKDSELTDTSSGLSADPLEMQQNFTPGGKNMVLGIRIKGKPESAFEKAPDRNFLKQRTTAHIGRALKTVNLILIADSDFLADRFWMQESETAGKERLYPLASNADLIINALDNLSGMTSLIDVRSKSHWYRPFTVIDEMAVTAERQYRAQEAILFKNLKKAQNRLEELTQHASVDSNDILSLADKEEIQALQKRIASLKESLRAVQNTATRDIASLRSGIILINVVLVPVILIITALFIAWRRRVRRTQIR